MKIICMEDQESKRRKIVHALEEAGYTDCRCCGDYITGMENLWLVDYDVLLLDMSMPLDSRRADSFQSFAGIAVLRELKRRKVNIKVIVITGFRDFETEGRVLSYEELEKTIIEQFPQLYCGHIQYSAASVEWVKQLQEKVENLK